MRGKRNARSTNPDEQRVFADSLHRLDQEAAHVQRTTLRFLERFLQIQTEGMKKRHRSKPNEQKKGLTVTKALNAFEFMFWYLTKENGWLLQYMLYILK